jgi:site-specific recombinase XerD
VKVHVERLVASSITSHAVDDDTSRWVATLDSVMLERLANAGLIPKRESATLRDFVSRYIESRRDVKPATRKAWNQALDRLSSHFGESRPLKSITAGDAAAWRQTLVNAELADATVRKYAGYVKQFFDVAVDHELIVKNPFRKLPSARRVRSGT